MRVDRCIPLLLVAAALCDASTSKSSNRAVAAPSFTNRRERRRNEDTSKEPERFRSVFEYFLPRNNNSKSEEETSKAPPPETTSSSRRGLFGKGKSKSSSEESSKQPESSSTGTSKLERSISWWFQPQGKDKEPSVPKKEISMEEKKAIKQDANKKKNRESTTLKKKEEIVDAKPKPVTDAKKEDSPKDAARKSEESISSTNTTTTISKPQPETTSTQPQPQKTLSNSTSAYMVMRSPFLQQPPQQQPPSNIPWVMSSRRQNQQRKMPNNAMYGGMGRAGRAGNMAVLDVMASSAFSTMMRLWLIKSISKWLSHEELMRPIQHFVWERLNDKYTKDQHALDTALATPPMTMSKRKWKRIVRKRVGWRRPKPPPLDYNIKDTFDKTVVVVEVGRHKDKKGKAIDVDHLEQVVSFLLTQHRRHAFGSIKQNGGKKTAPLPKELEVVLLVESPGGGVADFGLAASQVQRLSREAGIVTTVCVDNVAASGGYMIASQANHVFAAPFATVGSVGVYTQSINLREALERRGVKPLLIKAGERKAPLSSFGEVTKDNIKTVQRSIDKTHAAFQRLVVQGRPSLEGTLGKVCNGDVYLGSEAKDLSLVDRIITSEEYILERILEGNRVLKLHKSNQSRDHKRTFSPLDLVRHASFAGIQQRCKDLFCSESAADLIAKMMHTGSILGFTQYIWAKYISMD